MFKFRRLFRRKFNALLALLSLSLVVFFAACAQPTPEATTTEDVAAATSMPSEFRIGYQVIPNADRKSVV